ncbi:hypothetical protein [Aquimarina algiphila]|uniref:hypothetical protein n=1 Tax=Aquimarina algiphila TaxID=2047982 RepID=UPI002330A689|nr:hypothetical protein [Aquimarina algiphila]
MSSLKHLYQFKIKRSSLKNIKGGYEYLCIVQVEGFEDHYWTCHAPAERQCTNPVGLGSQTCISIDEPVLG